MEDVIKVEKINAKFAVVMAQFVEEETGPHFYESDNYIRDSESESESDETSIGQERDEVETGVGQETDGVETIVGQETDGVETGVGQDTDDDEDETLSGPHLVGTGHSYEILLYQACSLALTDVLKGLLTHLDVVDCTMNYYKANVREYHNCLLYDCLVIAIEKHHESIIEILLSHAAQKHTDTTSTTTSKSPRGRYKVLHWAAANGDVEVIKMLIKAGVDVNQKSWDGETALHVASDAVTAEILLNNGADVNAMNRSEKSPLYYACVSYRLGVIRELMEKGAKPNTPSMELNNACESGVDTNIASALMKFSSNRYENNRLFEKTCVYQAINDMKEGKLEEIYPLCAKDKHENQAMVQQIRESHFGIEVKTVHEIPQLHSEILALQKTGAMGLDITQPIETILTKSDTIVNAVNKFGTTALYLAVERNLFDVATLLLVSGADPNLTNCGKYPLITACRFLSHEFVRLLLDRGSNPNVADWYGKSPLFITAETYDLTLVKMLVEHGADVNRKDQKGRTILHSIVENIFMRCWHCSAVGCVDTVKYLLENGFNVNQTNAKGETLIASVIDIFIGSRCRGKYPRISIGYQLFELLLERGADVNLTDLKGNNAMTVAISGYSEYALFELLRHGGDPNYVNASGKSLIGIACTDSNIQCVRLLLDAGADINTITFLPDNGKMIDMLLNRGVIINTSNNYDNENLKRPTLGNFYTPFCGETECVIRLFKAGSSLQILADCCRSRRKGLEVRPVALPFNCPLAGLLCKAIVLAGYNVKQQLVDRINGSEDQDLALWLEEDSMTPPTLRRLCRTVIRRQLSAASGYRTILPLIDVLEIPKQMQMYLRFEGSWNEVDLNVSDQRTSCDSCASGVHLIYGRRFFQLPTTSTDEDAEGYF